MLGMPAVRADVDGHIFHHTEHRDVHLPEHLHAFLGIQQGQILRRRDDNRTHHRHLLRQGQLDITRTRRHVHHEIVEIIPGRLSDQLQQGTGDHRASPDHRRLVVGQEGHRHDLNAMRFQRDECLIVADFRSRTFGNAKHDALARPVDIRIQHAHPRPFARKRQRQVGSRGRFTDAALAGRDGNDVFDVGQCLNLVLRLV